MATGSRRLPMYVESNTGKVVVGDGNDYEPIGLPEYTGEGDAQMVVAKTNPVTGGVENYAGDHGPFANIEVETARNVKKPLWDGARRQLTDAGVMFKQFKAADFAIRTGSPTVSNVSALTGMPVPAINGSWNAVKITATTSFDELNVTDANWPDTAIDNMFGVLIYIEKCPGRAAPMTVPACSVSMTFSCDTGTTFANNVAVSWTANNLREGYNFLVWRPASDTHPQGTFVSNTGTGLASIRAGQTVKKAIFSLSGMNTAGTNIYVLSCHTGFRSKGGVVFNIDAAGSDVLTTVIPYMQQFGWLGNIFSSYSGTGLQTLDTLVPIDMKPTPGNVEAIHAAGWQISPHTMTHRNIAAMTDQSEVLAEYVMCRQWLKSRGVTRGLDYYAAPQNQISTDSYNTMAAAGAVVQRGYFHPNVQPMYWGIENAHFGSSGWENRTLDAAWAEIKTLLDYGAMTAIGWHAVITAGDPNDGSQYGAGGESAQWWSVARTILDRIRALEESGDVIVFKGFDDYCFGVV